LRQNHHLGNLWRRLVRPKRIDHWSLTSVQQRLVKTGGRVVKHARDSWFLLAKGHLTRHLFWAMEIPAYGSSNAYRIMPVQFRIKSSFTWIF
jgi:hypothetical protein